LAQDNYAGPKVHAPVHTSGINNSTPLMYLHHFDIIWDVCPDMMHIVKNFFEKLTIKVFNGSRAPLWDNSKNKKPRIQTRTTDPKYSEKLKKHEKAKVLWKQAVARHASMKFTAAQQSEVDRRVKHLVGPSKWIKKSMVVHIKHA
jgi:hypothetical protein